MPCSSCILGSSDVFSSEQSVYSQYSLESLIFCQNLNQCQLIVSAINTPLMMTILDNIDLICLLNQATEQRQTPDRTSTEPASGDAGTDRSARDDSVASEALQEATNALKELQQEFSTYRKEKAENERYESSYNDCKGCVFLCSFIVNFVPIKWRSIIRT